MNAASSSKPMPPGMKFLFARIFPVIFVVIGVGVAVWGIRELLRAQASLRWPSAQGRVVKSSVERRIKTGSNGRWNTTYHAKIRYTFNVGDMTFNGTRIAYGDYGSSHSAHARRVAQRYPQGSQVTVRYMPGRPEECLLEAGVQRQAWFLPGFGLFFWAAGSFLAVFAPKAFKRQESIEQESQRDTAPRAL